ncbi:DUF5405 family protein [Citrobacter freundii]|jgi:hypothetical protein|uniref:DUF5405 family protein n=1 Tax=Citrobacter freundii TaxID=546 RepID=UPI0014957835|nr:DUF5405 family protein [Citrobacter freundii]EKW1653647.1 DUF5405 family protein [Citrobacter freundii]DAY80612.1 MAG TPA: protein of unknown function (DUF5405) [Caudoviricetes sp.]
MSIRIDINNQYVITSDRYQFILQEKKTAVTGRNAGKDWLNTVGFYPTISKLVSGLLLHNILTGEARQFSDLEKQVERLGEKCQEAFSSKVER